MENGTNNVRKPRKRGVDQSTSLVPGVSLVASFSYIFFMEKSDIHEIKTDLQRRSEEVYFPFG